VSRAGPVLPGLQYELTGLAGLSGGEKGGRFLAWCANAIRSIYYQQTINEEHYNFDIHIQKLPSKYT
jgi:hypothetical protein